MRIASTKEEAKYELTEVVVNANVFGLVTRASSDKLDFK